MKKLFAFVLAVLICCLQHSLAALASDSIEVGTLEDGEYFAISSEYYDGWMDFLSFSVEDGIITAAKWDSLPQSGYDLKSTLSANGEYSMKDAGAQLEWNEQVQLFTNALVGTPGLSVLNIDDEGKTDAISGVTISIDGVYSLYAQAITNGSQIRGELQDGLYCTEADEYVDGYKEYIAMYVNGGHIVWLNWNAISEDGSESKKSLGNSYGMRAKSGIGAEWYEQAQAFEDYVIQNQGVDELLTDDDGTTDAISGCTMMVSEAVEMTAEIIEIAKADIED